MFAVLPPSPFNCSLSGLGFRGLGVLPASEPKPYTDRLLGLFVIPFCDGDGDSVPANPSYTEPPLGDLAVRFRDGDA